MKTMQLINSSISQYIKKISSGITSIIIVFSLFFALNFSLIAGGSAGDFLVFSAERGQMANVKKALKMGAYVNSKDYFGKTALMYAAINGNLEMTEYLILHGAGSDFSLRDREGKTALMYAGEKEQTKIIELLKKYGATE